MTAGTGISRAGRGLLLRFGDLEENAAGILWVNKVDACATGADLWLWVEQANALCAQVLGECIHVVGAQAHLLQARALLVDELRDSGLFVQRCQQLDHAVALGLVLRADHGLANALLLVDLFVVVDPAESGTVELDCCVEVRDGDADVVEANNVLVWNFDRCNIRHDTDSSPGHKAMLGFMIIAFSVAPAVTNENADMADAVAEAVRVVRESGLPNETNAMFTLVEGEWDEVMDVVKRATDAVLAVSPRASLVLKADIRPGHEGQLTRKVQAVEERLNG